MVRFSTWSKYHACYRTSSFAEVLCYHGGNPAFYQSKVQSRPIEILNCVDCKKEIEAKAWIAGRRAWNLEPGSGHKLSYEDYMVIRDQLYEQGNERALYFVQLYLALGF